MLIPDRVIVHRPGGRDESFNWDLKTCNISSMFFKLSGSLFHEDGPETEKERGPKVLVRVRGMWRLPCAAERSGQR